MNKINIKSAIFVAMCFGSNFAFACPQPTCTSTPTGSTTVTTGITGNVNNSIFGSSTSSIGLGGTSFASSTAGVKETATGAAGVFSNTSTGPNGTISGNTSTVGSAYATGKSVTTGTGEAATNAVAYGTGTTTVDSSLVSKNANGSLNLSGTATSGNQVGIGYATNASGNSSAAGNASVKASSANNFSATGTVASCSVPTTGVINDTKFGITSTPAPVINSAVAGNGVAGAFSPFVNNTTSTATQNISVVGSFVAASTVPSSSVTSSH